MQVGTNGIVAFGSQFTDYVPRYFPSSPSSSIFHRHIIAPFWADHDATNNGLVSWEMYSAGDSQVTNGIIQNVSRFIRANTNFTNFIGSFVFVAHWNVVPPFSSSLSGVS